MSIRSLHDKYLLWNVILVENHQVVNTEVPCLEAKHVFSREKIEQKIYHLDLVKGPYSWTLCFPNIVELMSLSWANNLKMEPTMISRHPMSIALCIDQDACP